MKKDRKKYGKEERKEDRKEEGKREGPYACIRACYSPKTRDPNRWEFDKKRLFEKTNHMAKICQDLKEVAEVLDQFHQFLGPELRAVTGDSQGIEKVSKRVESLVEPLDSIPFDIFDSKYKTRWDNVMATFRELVIDIEVMTKGFIDSSFQKLRSAEGAFELLQKFKAIKSRESINKQMAEKFDDILLQYSKEVEVISELFHSDKVNPPTFKNYPPVAGSIAWARSLYHRVKKPILRFKTMKNLLESEKGTEAKEKYLVLARAIDVYIKERFEQWNSVVPETATSCLKLSILGPVAPQKPGEPYKLGPVSPLFAPLVAFSFPPAFSCLVLSCLVLPSLLLLLYPSSMFTHHAHPPTHPDALLCQLLPKACAHHPREQAPGSHGF